MAVTIEHIFNRLADQLTGRAQLLLTPDSCAALGALFTSCSCTLSAATTHIEFSITIDFFSDFR